MEEKDILCDARQLCSAVDIATMTDLDQRDGSRRVVDGVQDAVASLADAVLVEGGQLLASRRARLHREGRDPFVDAPIGVADGYIRPMLVDSEGGRWFAVGDKLWSLSADGHWVDRTAASGLVHPAMNRRATITTPAEAG